MPLDRVRITRSSPTFCRDFLRLSSSPFSEKTFAHRSRLRLVESTSHSLVPIYYGNRSAGLRTIESSQFECSFDRCIRRRRRNPVSPRKTHCSVVSICAQCCASVMASLPNALKRPRRLLFLGGSIVGVSTNKHHSSRGCADPLTHH